MVKKFLVTIEADDIDSEEYVTAIGDACIAIAEAPMIGTSSTVYVEEVANG